MVGSTIGTINPDERTSSRLHSPTSRAMRTKAGVAYPACPRIAAAMANPATPVVDAIPVVTAARRPVGAVEVLVEVPHEVRHHAARERPQTHRRGVLDVVHQAHAEAGRGPALGARHPATVHRDEQRQLRGATPKGWTSTNNVICNRNATNIAPKRRTRAGIRTPPWLHHCHEVDRADVRHRVDVEEHVPRPTTGRPYGPCRSGCRAGTSSGPGRRRARRRRRSRARSIGMLLAARAGCRLPCRGE